MANVQLTKEAPRVSASLTKTKTRTKQPAKQSTKKIAKPSTKTRRWLAQLQSPWAMVGMGVGASVILLAGSGMLMRQRPMVRRLMRWMKR